MHSTYPAYSRNIPLVSFLFLAWFVYLSTLSPTIFYRDTPEFVDTVFTLGISHPAGFPVYNLLAKALTFFPMGSVPFKVNLFSSLMGSLALWVLYMASVAFLKVVAGPEDSDAYSWSALIPIGFLAFCIPFWSNTMLAEVYTLHTLFTGLIILGLLKWKEKKDIRYLYSAALVYGLSAGNHGTVVFYLPAILVLFFFWCQHDRWKHLSRCALFFLWGFSVYMYLPIRSLTEPTFDWGNPETLQGFLFQVTDQKDSHSHFAVLNQATASPAAIAETTQSTLSWVVGLFSKIQHIGMAFIADIYKNLSLISVIGFLLGTAICFRKSLPFLIFCAVIIGTNTAFFISWRGEAYLPSYVIVTLFTTLSLYRVIYTPWWKRQSDGLPNDLRAGGLMNRSRLVGIVLLLAIGLSIPWAAWKNYSRVDHSWNHLSETLTRQVYLTLPDHAVFVSGLSWFFYNYNQDVRRLRDDVTAVTVWDLISPHRTGLLTPRRYPNLVLPDEDKHDFNSLEGISDYTQDFLEKNSVLTPVIMEQVPIMYAQTKFTSRWQPYRNVLLRYSLSDSSLSNNGFSHQRSWEEFKNLLVAELSRPNSRRDIDWLNNPKGWIYSTRDYFHDTGRYELEREVLTMTGQFLGQSGSLQWMFRYLDNLIADHRPEKARILLDQIRIEFPEKFETWLGQGLISRAQGNPANAIEAFSKAASLRPESFRVHLEVARAYREMKKEHSARKALASAQQQIVNIRQVLQFKEELKRLKSTF
jgi:tetratricopeptide (TPR) repeat protein